MSDSIKDRVLKVIDKQLNKDTSQIKMDSRFTEDLGVDSLDRVEFVMALEEEFEQEITDEDAEKIATIQDAIDYIQSRS
jgi:acyl carrier protein